MTRYRIKLRCTADPRDEAQRIAGSILSRQVEKKREWLIAQNNPKVVPMGRKAQ